jgi:hypothetical protein
MSFIRECNSSSNGLVFMVLRACCACPLNNLMDGTHCFFIRFSNNIILAVYKWAGTRWGGDVVGGHSWRACMFGSRVYPLPARTSRCLGGGRQLAVTVMSLAGGHRAAVDRDWPIVRFA